MRIRPLFLVLLALAAIAAVVAVALGGDDDKSSGGRLPPGVQISTGSVSPSAGEAPVAGTAKVRLSRVGSFDEPIYVTAPPGDTKRVFVVERPGRIRVIADGKRKSKPFLDITGDTTKGGEQGLLSMAFAPDYASSGLFYVDYTDRNGDTRIQEFKRSGNPNRADKSSRRQVLFIQQPFPNHNGGLVLFGPDKLLYIGMGDGGDAGDPGNRAQNPNSLLGKLLRIDPRRSGSDPYSSPSSNPFVGKEGRDEIYSYGLRNPWRFSFDRRNGSLYIGDVGQDQFEEIDYEPEGKAKGKDFGWSCREGRHGYSNSRHCPDPVPPVLENSHAAGNCSITGGVVSRDPKLRGMAGRYVYGDFCKGSLRSFKISGGRATGDRALGINVSNLSSFGEDAQGRVYVVSLDGPVYRLKN